MTTNEQTYLLHFDRRYKQAGHYLGSTTNLQARLNQHAAGNGARLLQVVAQVGIKWRLVQTWPGGRDVERRLSHRDPRWGKRQKNSSRFCPICRRKRKELHMPPDPLHQLASDIYAKFFGHQVDQRAQADKIREIVEWLMASDVTGDDGFDFITAEWESYDAIDVRASGYYDIED